MSNDTIHVYFMPGMAANATIFEHISLPKTIFAIHLLNWFVPEKDMSLESYAREMCKRVAYKNVVLVGVSFGGILVQEMAKFLEVRKVIIISSVKTNAELPKRMIFAKYTKIHKVLPTGLINNIELLGKYAFGETVAKRLKLYERYLSIRDKYYIDWSIDQLVNWKQTECSKNVVHIQGEKDAVFPIKNINGCISVKHGTHTMIIHRYKWFNEHLPTIILD